MAALSETITALEKKTWEALLVSGTELLPFLSSKCTMLFPGGMMLHAESTPPLNESLANEGFKPWESYSINNVRVAEISQEAAVIMYTVEAKRPGQNYNALISSVWRQEAGDWKMLTHQQTPL